MSYFAVLFGLTVGNFIVNPDAALERSAFQGVAVLTVYLNNKFICKNN